MSAVAPPAAALLDSNVLVATCAEDHEHHTASAALFDPPSILYAVAAHSFAEAYTTLTRRGGTAPFRLDPPDAWAALESLRAAVALIGLDGRQTLDAIRRYAASDGTGPRLYDALIGEAAVAHGIRAVVTWNTRHMAGLFPSLEAATPPAFLAARVG